MDQLLLKDNAKKCALCGDQCSRQCPDYPFTPPLCQSLKKCHEQRHSVQELHTRAHWFLRCYKKKMNTSKHTGLPKKRPGRPKSSKDKKKWTVHLFVEMYIRKTQHKFVCLGSYFILDHNSLDFYCIAFLAQIVEQEWSFPMIPILLAWPLRFCLRKLHNLNVVFAQ